MSVHKTHIRHCILYEFKRQKGKANAAKATRSICSTYGVNAVDVRTCQRWFTRFKAGNFDLDDKERDGRPVEADDTTLEELLKEDPRQSTRELALKLYVSQSTVCNRLKALGKVQRVGRWIPHELSQINISQRLNISYSLLSRQKKRASCGKL